jgi:hypothetical protein
MEAAGVQTGQKGRVEMLFFSSSEGLGSQAYSLGVRTTPSASLILTSSRWD